MALPPGFLDELRTRLTLSQVVGRKVTWDARKSNMAKGDFVLPNPWAAIRRAAPFGDVSKLPKPWKFNETFLFNADRKFKPMTLDQR